MKVERPHSMRLVDTNFLASKFCTIAVLLDVKLRMNDVNKHNNLS